MKLFLVAAVFSFFAYPFAHASAHAFDREKQPSLELFSRDGVKIIVSHSSETFQGINTFGIDVHIEEIQIFTNGLNHQGHVDAYFNGQNQ
ncbi:MAG: hypothetical protein WEB87_02105 [Bacteriovoracaceae bacterium]